MCSNEEGTWLKHMQYNFLKKKKSKYFKIAYCYTSCVRPISYAVGKTAIITDPHNTKIWNSYVGRDISTNPSSLILL